MKTIKVFLASSDELKPERLEFSDLVLELNKIFKTRKIEIELSKWEHSDSSMGIADKQDEYNEELKSCEMALVLYWTKFGEYTKSELDTAYKELCEGRNPHKLYVFFKDTDNITTELRDFKNSFSTEYGHFYCRFENVDTMRLHFLLQFENYQNKNLSEPWLKVENAKVLIDNSPIVDLKNIPFANMNETFQKLSEEISELNDEIRAYRGDLLTDPDNETTKERLSKKLAKRQKTHEEFNQHQNFLFELARTTAKLSTERITKRMAEAIQLFNQGDAIGANAVLDTEAMVYDKNSSKLDYRKHAILAEQARIILIDSMNEFRLKVDTVLADDTITIESRIEQAKHAYEESIDCALELKYNIDEKKQYAYLLFDYAQFSTKYAFYDKVKELYVELIDIYTVLNSSADEKYQIDLATLHNNIGLIYNSLGSHNNAFKHLEKALKIREKVLGENNLMTANSYHNIGIVYNALGSHKKALEYYKKTMKICKAILTENDSELATINNSLGNTYRQLGNNDKALEYLEKALKIREKVLGKDHPDTADTYQGIGFVYSSIKEYKKALEYLEKALKIRENVLGKNHPDTADTYQGIGFVYSSIKEYKKALEYLEKALKIRENVLGENHRKTANSYYHIGRVYNSLGNYKKALEYLEKGLKIFSTILGENHSDTIQTKDNIEAVKEQLASTI